MDDGSAAVAPVEQGAVQIVVLDDADLPIPRVLATLTGSMMMGARQQETDEDGRLRFDGLPPGPYEVTLQHQGFKNRIAHVTVWAGQVSSITSNLELARPECIILWEPTLLTEGGWRGADLEAELFHSLPALSLGGLDGLLASSALGTDEVQHLSVEGVTLPAEIVASSLPWWMVGSVTARSSGQSTWTGQDLEMFDNCLPEAESRLEGLVVPGAGGGGRGGLSVGSNRARRYGVAGLDVGAAGEAAGIWGRAIGDQGGEIDGAAFGGPAGSAAFARGVAPLSSKVALRGDGAVSTSPGGPEARLDSALRARLGPTLASTELGLLASEQGVGGLAALAGHAYGLPLSPWLEGRARFGEARSPRLESSVGLGYERSRLAAFAVAGQRWEGLELVDGGEVRAREALGGIVMNAHPLLFTLSGRLAARQDGASGEDLPGRADLQLRTASAFDGLPGVATLTWRPPVQSADAALPQLEGGALVATPELGNEILEVQLGLALEGERSQDQWSGGAAGRAEIHLEWNSVSLELWSEYGLGEGMLGAPVLGLAVSAD